ncbi:RES family NAD+ phosphorylase [Pseudogemmobacter sonorensis]|uniref:RES family NAD+ phosphorylase n=1 Tax=Pseudogemmobacter sonorensis TaxID=2989681 RepID=UPI0036AAAC37
MIRSIHPPIDLFEDIADPADWEALASAEAKTNPRLYDEIGNLSLVPVHRRVGGPGASFLMAPFVHCSPDRPGRFLDGSYGVYYAADSEETAIYEVAHHHAKFMRDTNQPAGWVSDFRCMIGSVDLDLHDLSDVAEALDPDAYGDSQNIASALRAGGAHGLFYPSVRFPTGHCVAIFWPDLLPVPRQGDHYKFHFDGSRVDRVRNLSKGIIYKL